MLLRNYVKKPQLPPGNSLDVVVAFNLLLHFETIYKGELQLSKQCATTLIHLKATDNSFVLIFRQVK